MSRRKKKTPAERLKALQSRMLTPSDIGKRLRKRKK
jgi:hypothetical protein